MEADVYALLAIPVIGDSIMAENKAKGISSHLADAFFQIEELKKGHLDQQDLILVKLETSVNAIAREVYQLKHEARELERIVDS
jgi:hypothetical protein